MFLDENKIPLSMLRLSFLDKSKFTGSYKNKRYMFEVYNKDNKKILLHIYPDKFCYDKTDTNDIQTFEFEYSKTGIVDGLNYLSSIFDKNEA